MTELEFSAVLPIGILVLAAIVCMLLGTARRQTAAAWCSTIGLLGVAAAAGAISTYQLTHGLAFSDSILVDPVATYFQLLTLVIVALVGLGSREYLLREALPPGEFYALLLLAASGMCLVVAANDLLVVFLGLEISALCGSILAGMRRTAAAAAESSLKHFLLGSFATAFFLYGVALLYGVSGSTKLSAIRALWYGGQSAVPASFSPAAGESAIIPAQFAGAGSGDILLGAAAALLFVGLAVQVSAAPFCLWAPDVYQGAPAPAAAFLSTAPVAVAFAAFLRIFLVSLGASAALWREAMWLTAALTMTIGNFAALRQTNVKRLLAYSSIAHVGYVLVAFAAASQEGAAGMLFYLGSFSVMNVGAFLLVSHIAGSREHRMELQDYFGLGLRAPTIAAYVTIFLLSLTGIPLTAGFLAKFYIFRSALQSDLLALVIIGALNSAVAAYYYLRIIGAMYMHPSEEHAPAIAAMPPGLRAVISICAVATLLLGVYPHPIMRLAQRAAAWLVRY